MADEQTIYLSPEEELTSVRERLERTQARRIILVIPQQTQLRSHVGWRLIHARMRELNKDLLVISPDRQIRAVARAAGFRVAETQESPSNRPRTGGTRPGNVGTRGASRSRVSPSRGAPENRTVQQGGRKRSGPTENRPLPRPQEIQPSGFDAETAFQSPMTEDPEAEIGNQGSLTTFFETDNDRSNPTYGLKHIDTTPSVRPSVQQAEDEEETFNYYDDDYNTTQIIREAASRGSSEPVDSDFSDNQSNIRSQGSTAERWDNDHYISFEDDQQLASLPEQQGSAPAPIEENDISTPDISDRPTDVIENPIEDLGDLENIANLQEIRPAPQPDESTDKPPRRNGPSSSRRSPRAPRIQDYDEDAEQLLPPDMLTRGSGRPSRNLQGQRTSQPIGPGQYVSQPLNPGRPSRNLQGQRTSQPIGPGQHVSQPLSPGRPSRDLQGQRTSQPIGRSQRPSQPIELTERTAPPAGRKQRVSQPIGRPPQASTMGRAAPQANPAGRTPFQNSRLPSKPSAPVRRAPRKGNRTLIGLLLAALLLLVIICGLLFYLVPTATVNVVLSGQNYSQTVQLKAVADSQATNSDNVPTQTLQKDFTVSGQGTATGTAQVGNSLATGHVAITNNGNQDVIVPMGTLLTTTNGILFVTNAEPYIQAHTTFPFIPIIAKQQGDSGNVEAGQIKVIPQSSITSIALRNSISVSSTINLAVTNDQATTGGGFKNQQAVSTGDLQKLTLTLHKQLQQMIQQWLNEQMHTGDLHGSPIPDILDNTTPLPVEQLKGAPTPNQPVTDGKFSGTLNAHISVLVAREQALQQAASKQINATVMTLSQPSMLSSDLPVTLSHVKTTASKDGNTLTINAQANGEIIPLISTSALSSALAGKGLAQVESNPASIGLTQVGTQVTANVSPSFITILPLRADRIRVILHGILNSSQQHIPNG